MSMGNKGIIAVFFGMIMLVFLSSKSLKPLTREEIFAAFEAGDFSALDTETEDYITKKYLENAYKKYMEDGIL